MMAMQGGKKKRHLVRSIVSVLFSVSVLYLLAVLFLYMSQDSMIFHPQGLSRPVPGTVGEKTIENVELFVNGPNHIRGWLRRNDGSEKQKLVIYFGGNAEEVSHLLYDSSIFRDWSLALMNYRGFGQSDGKPEEGTLFEDSLKIYDYYVNRKDIDTTNIVVMGRSLGTGIATFVASKRTTKAVILISPFGSLADVAKERFPFAPVDLILRHRFDSNLYAPSVKVPLLCILGSADTIIRPAHSMRLAGKWGGPAEVHELMGLGHNDLLESKETWHHIETFLEQVGANRLPSQ